MVQWAALSLDFSARKWIGILLALFGTFSTIYNKLQDKFHLIINVCE